jgi:hypothetical protein
LCWLLFQFSPSMAFNCPQFPHLCPSCFHCPRFHFHVEKPVAWNATPAVASSHTCQTSRERERSREPPRFCE